MKYKYAIFIGRFEPPHLGHHDILNEGFEQAENIIIVLGSHNKARNTKNPWSSEERKEMILSTLSPAKAKRVQFVFMRDYVYNDQLWLSDILNKISEATNDSEAKDICLIGFKSDASSYYIDYFSKWDYISCPTDYDFHATDIRDLYFTMDSSYKKMLHSKAVDFLEAFKETENFKLLKDEYDYLTDYKEKWRGAPFPPTFVTVDSVVVKSGHILLVRRKGNLGKGCLALPGGFVNQDERLQDAALRELKEETSIKTSKEMLESSIKSEKVWDSPNRSLRGRVISHAYYINLGSGPLDKVKGGDDAAKAFWMPYNEAMQREPEWFEDHFFVFNHFINSGK